MFLLNEKEKESFLKVVYSANMFDEHIQPEEKLILESLKNEIFNLGEFKKIHLEKESLIVEEINKITKIIPVIYLFNILYELDKFYKKNNDYRSLNEEYICANEYRKKITSILEKVQYRGEIKKSKLFKFSILNDKTENYNKIAKDEPNEILEQISDSAVIISNSTKNIFNKLFK